MRLLDGMPYTPADHTDISKRIPTDITDTNKLRQVCREIDVMKNVFDSALQAARSIEGNKAKDGARRIIGDAIKQMEYDFNELEIR